MIIHTPTGFDQNTPQVGHTVPHMAHFTSYNSVGIALYNITMYAEDGSGFFEVKKGQLLLLSDTERNDHWRFKIETGRQKNDGGSGTILKTHIREAKFICAAIASSDAIAQAHGDLTINEREDVWVYCIEGDWALIKGPQGAGYVPRISIKLEVGWVRFTLRRAKMFFCNFLQVCLSGHIAQNFEPYHIGLGVAAR
ncbi:hypothetical protein B0J17DRAFT_398706 [Rhizoctonia solani]|nr:hypothetical protein B0J17DRAFT_398706 [Rhizoctonia solani]